LFYGRLLKIA